MKTRKDIGGTHRGSRFPDGDVVIRRINRRSGEVEGEYRSIREAIEACKVEGLVKVTYNGIYRVLTGLSRVHVGCRWESERVDDGDREDEVEVKVRERDACAEACEYVRRVRGMGAVKVIVVATWGDGRMESEIF